MTALAREFILRVRLSSKEQRRLEKLCKRFEQTPSALVRRLVADEAARVEMVTQQAPSKGT